MDFFQEYWYLLVGIIVLLAALVVMLLIYIRRSNKSRGQDGSGGQAQNVHRTRFVEAPEHSDNGTMLLFDVPRRIWITDEDRPDRKFEFPLSGESITVGYDRSNMVCLDYDDTVSTRHCRIFSTGAKTYLENLSMTNPAIVNGQRINASTVIYSGTEVIVGNVRLLIKFA